MQKMSHEHTANFKTGTILKLFKTDTKGEVCSLWWSYNNSDKCIWIDSLFSALGSQLLTPDKYDTSHIHSKSFTGARFFS